MHNIGAVINFLKTNVTKYVKLLNKKSIPFRRNGFLKNYRGDPKYCNKYFMAALHFTFEICFCPIYCALIIMEDDV